MGEWISVDDRMPDEHKTIFAPLKGTDRWKPGFIVIRMYYFNEDATGKPRGDAKPYTFAEIAEELEAVGIQRSEKILRKWRTKIVQDMTVQMWGADGALSVEAREPKQGQREADNVQKEADNEQT